MMGESGGEKKYYFHHNYTVGEYRPQKGIITRRSKYTILLFIFLFSSVSFFIFNATSIIPHIKYVTSHLALTLTSL